MPKKRLNLMLVLFIAVFADIATLAVAYDNAPYSRVPVRWNIAKLWGEATVLGLILATGTWLTEAYLFKYNGLARDSLIFLQIVLSENWLIFIARAAGRNWKSIPSWQLVLAVAIVDALAVVIGYYGWFSTECNELVPNCKPLDPELPQIVLHAVAVSASMAGIFFLIEGSVLFDRLVACRFWR